MLPRGAEQGLTLGLLWSIDAVVDPAEPGLFVASEVGLREVCRKGSDVFSWDCREDSSLET